MRLLPGASLGGAAIALPLSMGGVPREQKMLKGHLPSHISPSILVYEDKKTRSIQDSHGQILALAWAKRFYLRILVCLVIYDSG